MTAPRPLALPPPRLCVLGIPKRNASEANSFSHRLHRLVPKGSSREEPQRPGREGGQGGSSPPGTQWQVTS